MRKRGDGGGDEVADQPGDAGSELDSSDDEDDEAVDPDGFVRRSSLGTSAAAALADDLQEIRLQQQQEQVEEEVIVGGGGDGTDGDASGSSTQRGWIERWRNGGLRAKETPGYLMFQSITSGLATTGQSYAGEELVVSVGGDNLGDGLSVTLHSGIRGGVVKTMRGHTDKVVSVACDGRGVIASGGRDKLIKLWDLRAAL